MKGRFITFEGVEGCGKSTNITWAADYLQERGVKTLLTREPGQTQVGEEVRNVLLRQRQAEEPLLPMAELFLMFASRAQILEEVVTPALDAGTWVLCDRYVDSSIAYQGGGRELGVDRVKSVMRSMGDLYVEPDLTILLDLPPVLIEDRLSDRTLDRFENEDLIFFHRVRNTYLELADEESRIQVVDAAQSLDEIQRDIGGILNGLVRTIPSQSYAAIVR